MNICLLVLWGDSLTYTLAKALAFNGHQVRVRVADAERHFRAVWGTSQRIASIPGVSVVTNDDPAREDLIDHLIVQGHPLLINYRHLLDKLAPGANRITAISSGDRSRTYRQSIKLQMQEWRWYGRWYGKLGRIAYKDGFFPIDLLGLFKSRRVVGFDAHSKFLQDEALFKAIHARDWESDVQRPIRANFLGSRDPVERGRILDGVESYFTQNPDPAGKQKRMFWHAYTDAEPAALSQEEFLNALTESDFTLSPPGYSLVTHRPVEALLRGSIPVLNANERDLYDMGFADGVNCIAVPPGGWPAAMERISAMSETEVIAMRRSIKTMLADRVDYPALSRNICLRLGVGI